jgi:outer membrane protein
VLAFGAALGLLAGVPAEAQSLTDALVMAYRSNPGLLAERAAVRAQDEGVAQALSGWRPTVTVNANAGWQRFSSIPVAKAGSTPTSTELPRTGSLVAVESLYKGGKTEAQTRVADYNVLAERGRLDLTEETTLLNAALAYINVVEAQALLELNIANEKVLTTDLEATRDRFTVGEVTRTDVSQAEAQLSAAHAAVTAAASQLEVVRANYRNVVGVLPGALVDPGEPGGLPGTRDEALALAERENPSVKTALYTERAALANVDVQFSGLLPSLSLQGVLSKAEEQVSKIDNTTVAQVLMVLSLPIYTGGLADSLVRQAKEQVGQSRLQVELAQRQAIQDGANAWDTLVSARAQAVSFQDQIKANQVALEGTQQEALAGLRTVLDILNAQQALLTSQVSLVQSQHDAVQAAYNLLDATGRLTARARELPVEYYDPTAHYKDTRGKWRGYGEPVE